MMNTVTAPAATMMEAVLASMDPFFTHSEVTATMIGRAVVQYSATEMRSCIVYSARVLRIESEMMMGTVRTASSSATKRASMTGSAAIAEMSIFAPDTMKNSGMRKPKPMASSLVSSDTLPSGVMYRSTKPAANAPSTMSMSNSAENATRATKIMMVPRTDVCEVVFAFASRNL